MNTNNVYERSGSGNRSWARTLGAAALGSGLLIASQGWAGSKILSGSFGIVISQPGNYLLKKDIVAAPGQLGPAILITANNVHLNLGGRRIVGSAKVDSVGHGIPNNTGIQVKNASNVHIHNGLISGITYGVELVGVQDSHLNNLRIIDNFRGIWLRGGSHGNKINGNITSDHICCGIRSDAGNNNQIVGNTCDRNNQVVQLSGHNNLVEDNSGVETRFLGIWLVSGNDNTIRNNSLMNTDNLVVPFPRIRMGIALGFPRGLGGGVYAIGTIVEGNIALGNGFPGSGGLQFDVFDSSLFDSRGCENNWSNNVFVKDNETGPDAGPGQGCIQ